MSGMKPRSNLNMYTLVVTGGLCFYFGGFLPLIILKRSSCRHCPALPTGITQGEQDVRQNQTSALGLSHLWGWREQLVSRSAADQAL